MNLTSTIQRTTFALAAVLVTLVLSTVLFAQQVGATGETIYPIADSYVNSANASGNFGTATKLWADDDSTTGYLYTYLKFNIDEAEDNGVSTCDEGAGAGSVYLTLNTESATTGNIEVYQTGTSWTETGLTYNNRPADWSFLEDLGGPWSANTVVGGQLVALDSDAIAGICDDDGGILSLRVRVTNNDAVSFWTRENSTESLRPSLQVDVND